jgi:hypothetical protein
MKIGFWEFLRQSLQGEEPVNPVERRMAKRWVKERLKRLYPELRANPEELEKAYRQLGLEAHEGAGRGAGTVYEITLPSVAETGD